MKVSLVQKIRLKELKGKINMGNRLNLLRNNMKRKDFIQGERITNTNNKKKDIIINLFKSMRRKRENMRHNKNKFQKPIMFLNHK
jgi:protein tyrosine phosphatase